MLDKINYGAEFAFADLISYIDNQYDFSPVAFTNGAVTNEAGQNSGSCKVFQFALLNGLSEEETLACFAEHYQAVLDTPDQDNHQNIRNFMKSGFDGLHFATMTLVKK